MRYYCQIRIYKKESNYSYHMAVNGRYVNKACFAIDEDLLRKIYGFFK